MTSLGLSSTSDVITFDQNWHHLASTSAGGKYLSNDAQIRVITLMEPKICTKMLEKMVEKLRAKFPATRTHGCSIVTIARLDDTFLEVFLTARKPSRRSITAAKGKEKEKKERGKKFQTSKSLKTLACENSRPSSLPARVAGAKKDDCFRKLKDVGHLKILISAHARVIIS